MRYKCVVSYSGTKFYGFQIQAKEKERSVQKELQDVLKKMINEDIIIQASGRTDKGVHALGQVFHFDTNKELDLYRFKHSFNCLLPDDIYIRSMEKVDESFHARYSAKSKTYMYLIRTGEYDVFRKDQLYNYNKELDLERIKEASNLFIGEHNFQNFCCNDEDFVRTIYSIDIESSNGDVEIYIRGNGFRRYMVRMIIGTLVAYSKKQISLEKIKELLDGELNRVNYKWPGQGLYLIKVDYD